MKEIKTNKTYTVELTEAEVELIKGFTQNCGPDEYQETRDLCLGLFVGMSRLQGMDMTDDGKLRPQIKGM